MNLVDIKYNGVPYGSYGEEMYTVTFADGEDEARIAVSDYRDADDIPTTLNVRREILSKVLSNETNANDNDLKEIARQAVEETSDYFGVVDL